MVLSDEIVFGIAAETVATRAVLNDTYNVEPIIACRKLKRVGFLSGSDIMTLDESDLKQARYLTL